ncbi:hypothetical protein [Pedobacter sp. Leaf176]|uniref:hypothetical protein n=1 Tax=Pedobacter sp. Leaf176 TaxID=1736286 RepID=UPI0006F26997|nr:hypothetical protein [Pedobacter sp. Leaf176]KQR67248.1 hypothetical protein ASF92_16185 [Pedobacter sp. Leaf176]
MNQIKFAFTILLLLSLTACKKDQNEYRMVNKDFITPVYYEQVYQQALIKTLAAIPGEVAINAFALKRQQLTESYLAELAALSSSEDWPMAGSLPDDKIQKLAEVNRPIPENKAKLIELLKISDQDMIGFHVKATCSVGLRDKALRDWSNDKLKILLNNLNETQTIKP